MTTAVGLFLDNFEEEANEIGEDCVGQATNFVVSTQPLWDDSSSEESAHDSSKAESNAKATEPSNENKTMIVSDPELKDNEKGEDHPEEDHFLLQMCPDEKPYLAGVCCFALGFCCLI